MYGHKAELFSQADVFPLDVHRKMHTASFVYQGLNEQSTSFVNGCLSRVSNVSARMTRSRIENKLYIPRCRTELAKGNVRVRGASLSSTIPMEIRESSNVNTFRKHLKQSNPFIRNFL